jgi:fructose-1,6-bisphosphatase/inositol monophosphatase family enzyme
MTVGKLSPTDANMQAILKNTLLAAYNAVHGKNDLKKMTSTSIDIATRGDAVAGDAMIAYLKGVPQICKVYTEEQGEVILNEDGTYSAIIDDIDGTKNFREGLGMLPHGPIAGIFRGQDPRFKDCIVAGYLDFPSGNYVYAMKGHGCHVYEGFSRTSKPDPRMTRKLATTGRKELFIEGKNLTLLPDIYMLGDLAPAFMEYSARAWLGDFRTTAAQLALVAAGSADIFVTAGDNAFNKNKIKMGEEIGPGWLLITEAGGAVVDWAGRDIRNERIALGEKKPWHFIAAATPELAKEFAEDIAKKPAIAAYMQRKGLGALGDC